MTPQEAIDMSKCVACLSPGDQMTIRTYAALQWIPVSGPGACQPVIIHALSNVSRVQGSSVSVFPYVTNGTAPFTWSMDPIAGFNIDTDSGLMTGTMPLGTTNVVIRSTNTCGSDSKPFQLIGSSGPGSYTVRWANFLWAESPAAAPTFVETDFLGGNANYVDGQTLSTGSRVGNYIFVARSGARQVFWLPDSLGMPSFSVSGFPWQLDPAPNTALQNLSISGEPGKVFFTSQQNTGGYTLSVS